MAAAQEVDHKLRVLVVDDDADTAASHCEILRFLGCKAESAFGIATGIQMASLFRPDVVLVDLDLDGEDGCDFVAAARRMQGLSHAVFVCVTGADTYENRRRCCDSGFGAFLAKPLEVAALRKYLESASQRRTERSEDDRARRQPTPAGLLQSTSGTQGATG